MRMKRKKRRRKQPLFSANPLTPAPGLTLQKP
jgi:hypothetical protein